MIDILSFGGGVGSWGYAAAVVQGKVRTPWLAVIVDTGREIPLTWLYLDTHKDKLPFELHVIKQPLPSLWSGNGGSFLPGGYSVDGGAWLRGFCSAYWKRDVLRRYLIRVASIKTYNLAFGIHADEYQRMTTARQKSVQNIYPLVDLGITRAECADMAVEVFGELPPRSRCWMCPGQVKDEWREVKVRHPTLYSEALQIDQEARDGAGLTLWRPSWVLDDLACDGACFT